jgi:hypothetical protein
MQYEGGKLIALITCSDGQDYHGTAVWLEVGKAGVGQAASWPIHRMSDFLGSITLENE